MSQRRYWTSAPKPVEGALMPMWGCYIFTSSRTMAVGQGFGRDAEEAHNQAHCIIGAMLAVEDKPAVAAAARHYIVRSPIHEGVAVHCSEDTTLQMAYDHYFDECEKAQRVPLPYDKWRAQQ